MALFQTVDPAARRLTGRALDRRLVLAMIERRATAAGLPPSTCCHTFRATGITASLSNGGTLERAQQIAGHASPKTTKLYDRTADTVTVDEIERIGAQNGRFGRGGNRWGRSSARATVDELATTLGCPSWAAGVVAVELAAATLPPRLIEKPALAFDTEVCVTVAVNSSRARNSSSPTSGSSSTAPSRR